MDHLSDNKVAGQSSVPAIITLPLRPVLELRERLGHIFPIRVVAGRRSPTSVVIPVTRESIFPEVPIERLATLLPAQATARVGYIFRTDNLVVAQISPAHRAG